MSVRRLGNVLESKCRYSRNPRLDLTENPVREKGSPCYLSLVRRTNLRRYTTPPHRKFVRVRPKILLNVLRPGKSPSSIGNYLCRLARYKLSGSLLGNLNLFWKRTWFFFCPESSIALFKGRGEWVHRRREGEGCLHQ